MLESGPRRKTYTFEEGGYYKVLAGNPIAVFTCASTTYTVTGTLEGALTVSLNTTATTGAVKFGAQQGLEVLDPQGVAHAATLSSTATILDASQSSAGSLDLRAPSLPLDRVSRQFRAIARAYLPLKPISRGDRI